MTDSVAPLNPPSPAGQAGTHGTAAGEALTERRIQLQAATNFRDVGGYASSLGGSVRWRRVFRADGLHRLSEGDLQVVTDLGVGDVIDVRSEQERSRYPDRVPSSHLALSASGGQPGSAALSMASVTDGEVFLRDLYTALIEDAALTIGLILRRLAYAPAPTVIHCTGGKDRTGVVVAILLEVLGVGRREVLDDYELTSQFRRRIHQEDSVRSLVAAGMPVEAAAGVLGTPRWAMAEALDLVDGKFGGSAAYAREQCGLTLDDLATLRASLLTSDA